MSSPGTSRNKKNDDHRTRKRPENVSYKVDSSAFTPEDHARLAQIQASLSQPMAGSYSMGAPPAGPLDVRMGNLNTLGQFTQGKSINDFPYELGGRARTSPDISLRITTPTSASAASYQTRSQTPQPQPPPPPNRKGQEPPAHSVSRTAQTSNRISLTLGQRNPQAGPPQDPRYSNNY
ncbi:unnamed protein product [Mycena citricolor]|uniref:Uncharacterized protein n=1 Tax=Mycena citricolor TaxID=2018698 RepID=A0AAD2HTU7_9AGAR|nr:unnamed protein product [Mycena citricolor]